MAKCSTSTYIPATSKVSKVGGTGTEGTILYQVPLDAITSINTVETFEGPRGSVKSDLEIIKVLPELLKKCQRNPESLI